MEPEVELALRQYRQRAVRTLGLGVLGVIAGIATAAVAEGVGTVLMIFGLMAIGLGATGALRTFRIRRMATRQGWRRRAARFRVAAGGGNGQPALLLLQSDTEPEAVLSVSTTVFRWSALDGSEYVWLVGDPKSRFAAVGTTDFGAILVVKRPLLKWWRNRLNRIASGV